MLFYKNDNAYPDGIILFLQNWGFNSLWLDMISSIATNKVTSSCL